MIIHQFSTDLAKGQIEYHNARLSFSLHFMPSMENED